MLGTHSEPRRGQMSHICNISPLRVKVENRQVAKLAKSSLFTIIIILFHKNNLF